MIRSVTIKFYHFTKHYQMLKYRGGQRAYSRELGNQILSHRVKCTFSMQGLSPFLLH